MYVVPPEFRHGPFTRTDALDAGITPRVLEGAQFVRLHHQVYRHRSRPQCFEDDLRAARLALPDGARTTGITRIQELGLDTGPGRRCTSSWRATTTWPSPVSSCTGRSSCPRRMASA